MDEIIKAELERIRDEDRRQNRRIELLEEQRSQGERLDKLEQEPETAWKQAKTTIITAILSTVAGGLATGLIFILWQSIR